MLWSCAVSQNTAKNTKSTFSNPFENMNYNEAVQHMMDWSHLKNQMASNVQAMVAANQVTLEALQEGARRTWENVQHTSQRNMEAMKDAMGHTNPQEALHKAQEMVSQMIHTSANHASDLAEIANKAAVEALKIYSDRASEMAKCCTKKM